MPLTDRPERGPGWHMPTSQPTHRDLTRQTLGGLVWIGGGKVVYAGLRLLVLAILARLLSPADFGIVGAALVVVGFSAIFSQLGLAPAIVQRPVLERRHLEAAFSASVLFGLLLGVLLWVSAPLAARFFHIPGVEPVLRVLAWMFPLDGLSAIAESQVQRELRFRWLATMEVLTFVLGYGVVGVVLALLGAGVWALVAAQMAQTALYTVILIVSRPPALRLLPDRAAFGELMYYGGGFTVSKIANYFALQVDNLVVGRWLGATALGFYGRAYELMAGPPHLLGDAVDRVLFPAMASIQTDTRRLAEAYRRGVGLMALIMLPASLVLFIVAPELILAMLGPHWTAVVTPFQILALGMFLRTSYRISDVTARATAAVYHRAWRQLVYALCVLTGAWFGKTWGIAGVAAGVVGALAVNFFLMADLGLRLTRQTWRSFWDAHAPALALAAVAGLLAWGTAAAVRALGAPPLVLLVVTLTVTMGGLVLVVRSAPDLCFGPDGRWFVAALRAFLHKPQVTLAGAAPTRGNGTMPLVSRLAEALHAHGIRYCQWKGHLKRERWGAGDGDIDLLVDRADEQRFAAVLHELDFKVAYSQHGWRIPDQLHFFGFDSDTGKLLHLHVYYRLVVGRPWLTARAGQARHAPTPAGAGPAAAPGSAPCDAAWAHPDTRRSARQSSLAQVHRRRREDRGVGGRGRRGQDDLRHRTARLALQGLRHDAGTPGAAPEDPRDPRRRCGDPGRRVVQVVGQLSPRAIPRALVPPRDRTGPLSPLPQSSSLHGQAGARDLRTVPGAREPPVRRAANRRARRQRALPAPRRVPGASRAEVLRPDRSRQPARRAAGRS